MSRLDDLPPDQLAAVSLLLRRRKSYAEVAALLQIQERAVRDRAHAALAALAGGASVDSRGGELTPERREQIGDYLLGQQGVGERLRTRTLLESSAPARAWASAISHELARIAGAPLAEISAGADSREGAREHPDAYPARSSRQLPSSRLGGALLLAAIVAGVVIAVLALLDNGPRKRTGPGVAGTSTPTSSNAPRATENKRITLIPTDATSRAIGVAEVLSEGSKYAFYLAAEHLAPSKGFFYAVWLYNSPTSYEALSRSPPVASDGRLQGGALLPANAGGYHKMLLTRETSERPRQPGTVVLSGAFALH